MGLKTNGIYIPFRKIIPFGSSTVIWFRAGMFRLWPYFREEFRWTVIPFDILDGR